NAAGGRRQDRRRPGRGRWASTFEEELWVSRSAIVRGVESHHRGGWRGILTSYSSLAMVAVGVRGVAELINVEGNGNSRGEARKSAMRCPGEMERCGSPE